MHRFLHFHGSAYISRDRVCDFSVAKAARNGLCRSDHNCAYSITRIRGSRGKCMRMIHGLVMWASLTGLVVTEVHSAEAPTDWIDSATGHRVVRLSADRRHAFAVLPSEQPHAGWPLRNRRRYGRHSGHRDRYPKEHVDRPGQGASLVRRPENRTCVFLAQRGRRQFRAADADFHIHGASDRRKAATHRADRTWLHRLGECR